MSWKITKAYIRKHILEAVGTIVLTAITTMSVTSWYFTTDNNRQNETLKYIVPLVDTIYKNKQDYTVLNNKFDTLTTIVKENTELTKDLIKQVEEAKKQDEKETTKFWNFMEKYFGKPIE